MSSAIALDTSQGTRNTLASLTTLMLCTHLSARPFDIHAPRKQLAKLQARHFASRQRILDRVHNPGGLTADGRLLVQIPAESKQHSLLSTWPVMMLLGGLRASLQYFLETSKQAELCLQKQASGL